MDSGRSVETGDIKRAQCHICSSTAVSLQRVKGKKCEKVEKGQKMLKWVNKGKQR